MNGDANCPSGYYYDYDSDVQPDSGMCTVADKTGRSITGSANCYFGG